MFHPAAHIPAARFRVPRRWMRLLWLEEAIAAGLFAIFVICMSLLCWGLA